MEKIAVLGAGLMGASIAQEAAQAGYQVILRDLQMSFVRDGLRTIADHLEERIEKGQMSRQEKEQVLDHIHGTIDLATLNQVDLVIEAVVENMAVKKQLFTELDNICPEHTILATNTSSLSITEIAAATRRPDRVVGMHFVNPLPRMQLVELVKGMETSEETLQAVCRYIEQMNKNYVVVNRESPGYIVNRVLAVYINEAITVLGEGLADTEAIDAALCLGAGMSMGPLALADQIGLDQLHATLIGFYEEFRDSKYRPHIMFSTMLRAGYYGRKSGRGFYRYQD